MKRVSFVAVVVSIFFLFLMIAGGLYLYKSPKHRSTIIILNGPSASGKSSVQKELQVDPDLFIQLNTGENLVPP